ncbi:MAG TPA: cbb3-type cytochrome c oxidase subunit I [Rectinemataceae bacterium]|nr:cbb3-type cytochrome c oxidase subunit I [Rectinemataceae bacterium]
MNGSTAVRADSPGADISPWWRYGVLVVFLVGFGVLVWISAGAYKYGPPIPDRVLGPDGAVVFTGEDVKAGQEVFLKYGLMDNGTVWGHGAYLGPDFSASYLHNLSEDVAASLPPEGPAGVPAGTRVASVLSENRYESSGKVLRFTAPEVASYQRQIGLWTEHFASSSSSRGLPPASISDPKEMRQLVAFFAWTAWASAAHVPGRDHSYTNNFPYDPQAGNFPSRDSLIWSALSFIALLAGIGAVLFAFGRFDYLGWKGDTEHPVAFRMPTGVSPTQRSTLKFFVVVLLLMLAQTLLGGAVAHFRADPKSFYGLDLASILPSNLLRTWHLQTAVFWIATAYIGGGLFIAALIGKKDPKGQAALSHILFAALFVVVAGSLLGELLGLRQLLGKLWFWIGSQGWEYLEIGRAWQFALAVGLLLWVFLVYRGLGSAMRDPEQRELNRLFLAAAIAIPLFYLPAFFYDGRTTYTVVDTWRFWIIHLWVEGFFELFATTMVAVMFYNLGMVTAKTAKRVIYLDALLFLGAGMIGTGHHWYWIGQTTFSMAMSSVFSAMEVVPLILLTLDASAFMRLTRGAQGTGGKDYLPHRWTFYFLISVGVWNFVGAGVFGFLINTPIVSYYEVGTTLTPNHGHAAFMGVFGMLAMAFVVFVLRQVSDEAHWKRIERWVKTSFWGMNLGLGGMVVLSLFPVGLLQLSDVLRNGYWHARSAAFMDRPVVSVLEYLRLPADLAFIILGVLPLLYAVVSTYLRARKAPAEGA